MAEPSCPTIFDWAGSFAGIHMNGQLSIIEALPDVNTLVVSAMPT